MDRITVAYFVVALDGGVGNFILNYCSHLPKEDYRFILVTQDSSSNLYKNEFENLGFKIFKIPSKKESIIKNIKESIQIINREHVDIIHANMTATNFFPLFAGWLCGVKTRISHAHIVLGHTFALGTLKVLSKIFATDQFACGVDAGRSMFGKSHFTVVYNAIDLSMYEYDERVRAQVRSELNIEGNVRVIGHVGRFAIQKNHFFIIDVFSRLHKKNENSKLLLIGDGELLPKVREYVYDIGLQDSVIFTGAVNDVSQKMMAMDVFFLPSLYEGLPITLIEAQASGLPCVVSSSVDMKAKVTPEYFVVDLDKDLNEWVDLLLKINPGERKIDIALQKHYDIYVESKKLDIYYKTHIKS